MPVGHNSMQSQADRYTRFQEALDWVADMLGELGERAHRAGSDDFVSKFEDAELEISSIAQELAEELETGDDLAATLARDTIAEWSDYSDWLRDQDPTDKSPIASFEMTRMGDQGQELIDRVYQAIDACDREAEALAPTTGVRGRYT